MPSPSDRIGDDRLREILAGCATLPDDAWLIRKNGYFYRPNRQGYTSSKAEAGRYTEAEAKALHEHDPHRISAMPASEVPDEAYSLDPQTVASIVSELLSRRAADANRPTKEPAHGK